MILDVKYKVNINIWGLERKQSKTENNGLQTDKLDDLYCGSWMTLALSYSSLPILSKPSF